VHNVANTSAVGSLNHTYNDVSLFYEESGFESPQNGKTQAQTNVKDVQEAFNRAKRIKYLDHQIKAAPANVSDTKPRHSKFQII
jgi:hypothetical protein